MRSWSSATILSDCVEIYLAPFFCELLHFLFSNLKCAKTTKTAIDVSQISLDFYHKTHFSSNLFNFTPCRHRVFSFVSHEVLSITYVQLKTSNMYNNMEDGLVDSTVIDCRQNQLGQMADFPPLLTFYIFDSKQLDAP